MALFSFIGTLATGYGLKKELSRSGFHGKFKKTDYLNSRNFNFKIMWYIWIEVFFLFNTIHLRRRNEWKLIRAINFWCYFRKSQEKWLYSFITRKRTLKTKIFQGRLLFEAIFMAKIFRDFSLFYLRWANSSSWAIRYFWCSENDR